MANRIRINRRNDYREQLKLYLNYTKRLNAKLKKIFRKASINASTKYEQGFFVDDIFALEYGNELYVVLANQYRMVIEQNAKRLTRQRYKKAEPEITEIIEDYIRIHTAAEVTRISETTKKKLQLTIKNGLKDGDSIEDISRSIKKSSAFSTSRATLIARTETHNAMNVGNLQITKTLELNNPQKEWNNALDTRARTWHKNMDGKRKPIDEKFTVVTPTKNGPIPMLMSSPGDSAGGPMNVCNCRCFLTFYDEEDEFI